MRTIYAEYNINHDSIDVYTTIISYCLQSKGWSVFAFIVSLCGACLFGILLVYISVRKPAKIAANTSPISALKNPVGIVNYRTHKRHRITPVYLAKISFSRNRKKSLLTILSLGLCGVIFFLAASYQSSFNAESMARYWDMKYGDFKISIDLENEGLFTTLIALLITAVVGIPGGYAIGIFLKNAGMSTGFVFPVVAFTLFAVAMFMLESLMTILLIHSWKKQSVIAIMRN